MDALWNNLSLKHTDAWDEVQSSDLIGLECGLDIEIFKSSPGEPNMWLKLRTTDLGAQTLLWALGTYTSFLEKT